MGAGSFLQITAAALSPEHPLSPTPTPLSPLALTTHRPSSATRPHYTGPLPSLALINPPPSSLSVPPLCRPGVYREFTKDLSESITTAQSHNIHKLMGFEPFAPTALFLRIIVSYFSLQDVDPSTGGGWLLRWWRCGTVVATRRALTIWPVLFVLKMALGFFLKVFAVSYVERYNQRFGAKRGSGSSAVTHTAGGATPVAAAGQPKKEE
jgi:hypothetical protein